MPRSKTQNRDPSIACKSDAWCGGRAGHGKQAMRERRAIGGRRRVRAAAHGSTRMGQEAEGERWLCGERWEPEWRAKCARGSEAW